MFPSARNDLKLQGGNVLRNYPPLQMRSSHFDILSLLPQTLVMNIAGALGLSESIKTY